jgi:hypothetical protein
MPLSFRDKRSAKMSKVVVEEQRGDFTGDACSGPVALLMPAFFGTTLPPLNTNKSTRHHL